MSSLAQTTNDALARVAGSVLKLQPHGSTPPVNSYVTQNMFLQVKVMNAAVGVTVVVAYQILLPDGTVSINQQSIVVQTTRSLQGFFFPLTEGFLLGVCIAGEVVANANRTFVQAQLSMGGSGVAFPIQVLCQGYLTLQSFLTWPNGNVANNTDGAGAIVSVTGTTPGAGAEISETVPNNAVWRIKSFTFRLTASATVANRIPHLIVDDGVNVLLDSPAVTAITAGQIGRVVAGDNAAFSAQIDSTQWVEFIADLRLMPSSRIRTLTTGLQVGDQYTPPQYLVEEYLVR